MRVVFVLLVALGGFLNACGGDKGLLARVCGLFSNDGLDGSGSFGDVLIPSVAFGVVTELKTGAARHDRTEAIYPDGALLERAEGDSYD